MCVFRYSKMQSYINNTLYLHKLSLNSYIKNYIKTYLDHLSRYFKMRIHESCFCRVILILLFIDVCYFLCLKLK